MCLISGCCGLRVSWRRRPGPFSQAAASTAESKEPLERLTLRNRSVRHIRLLLSMCNRQRGDVVFESAVYKREKAYLGTQRHCGIYFYTTMFVWLATDCAGSFCRLKMQYAPSRLPRGTGDGPNCTLAVDGATFCNASRLQRSGAVCEVSKHCVPNRLQLA